MEEKKYPTLAISYILLTDIAEFDECQKEPTRYLVDHGLHDTHPALKTFTEFRRNETASREQIQTIVGIILDETASWKEGPKKLQAPPRAVPIIRAFYEKFVQGKDIDWGAWPDVDQALVAEIEALGVIW